MQRFQPYAVNTTSKQVKRDATFQRGRRRIKKDVQNLLQKQLAKKD